jgi:hypothetical protein
MITRGPRMQEAGSRQGRNRILKYVMCFKFYIIAVSLWTQFPELSLVVVPFKRPQQTRFQILSSVILNHTGKTQGVPRKFSRDGNYRRQNPIENTIWQCFEGFLTRFHEHAS